MLDIQCSVNGRAENRSVLTNWTLADWLRIDLGLGGTRVACDHGVCGACTVLLDGRPVASCAAFAFEADGRTVTTIEGLPDSEKTLHRLQRAFIETGASQCGFCTAGMLLLAQALIASNPAPTRSDIKDWMAANICRCSGYEQIVQAIELCVSPNFA